MQAEIDELNETIYEQKLALDSLNESISDLRASLTESERIRDEAVRDLNAFTDLRIKSLTIEDGKLECKGESEILPIFAACLSEVFLGSGGINYVEFQVLCPRLGPMILSMQRRDGKRPSEMYSEARLRIDELESQLREVSSGST